ncbi:hypothetical protein KDL01_00470 [Actinospica durhamensis]|uniref:Uncharacterized protein n=1 Tax=Actinospica durhamensis TaxID=1508375 RepID=A0A941EFI3_9ACTN|nr:hypothetical protein [Actinospica durhamensis]MBR7831710.1 hypothetical protein [Actinospica durhamensis]
MNPNEDDRVLVGVLERSVGEVRFDRETQGIVSRGRTLSRRRRAVPALATAGVVAASLSFAVTTTQHGKQTQQAQARQTPSQHPGSGVLNVENASFTVHTDVTTGVVTVKLSLLADPSQLQALLKKAGIPLDIVNKELPESNCVWTGAKAVGIPSGVVGGPTVDAKGYLTAASTITFDPAKMPKGDVLGVVEIIHNGETAGSAVTGLSNWPTGCVTQ